MSDDMYDGVYLTNTVTTNVPDKNEDDIKTRTYDISLGISGLSHLTHIGETCKTPLDTIDIDSRDNSDDSKETNDIALDLVDIDVVDVRQDQNRRTFLKDKLISKHL